MTRLRYRALTRCPARLVLAVRTRRQGSSNRARGRCLVSSLAGGRSAVSPIGSRVGKGSGDVSETSGARPESTNAENARSMSAGSRTSCVWIFSPIPCAAIRVRSASKGLLTFAGLNKRPTRDTPGTASRGRATRFGLSSVVTHVTPVTLPPGRARLETKVLDWPRATGRTSSSSTWPASATLHSTTCYCSSP